MATFFGWFIGSLLLVTNHAQTTLIEDYSCAGDDDLCPYQYDGECDSEYGTNFPECRGGDCADCNFVCEQFHLDCDQCQQHGCYWCPSDGVCANWDGYDFRGTQCNMPKDFIPAQADNDACSPAGVPFR